MMSNEFDVTVVHTHTHLFESATAALNRDLSERIAIKLRAEIQRKRRAQFSSIMGYTISNEIR